MCFLFSVFTLLYLILKNMSTNVNKFRFPCLLDNLFSKIYFSYIPLHWSSA